MSNETSGKWARVLFEYEPTQDDELRLAVGDKISDIEVVEDGWMSGRLNGRVGMFPDNFVELFTPGGDDKKLTKKKRYCRATFEYPAENPDELTIKVGDIIEITEEKEEGWYKGVLRSAEGCFPSNFVEEISEQAALKELAKANEKETELPATASSTSPTTTTANGAHKPVIGRAKVTFEYKAEAPDELDLVIGCIIEITSKDVSDGWWEGRINGKVGVFPDNFVELIPEELSKKKEPAKPMGVQVLPVPGKVPLVKPSELKSKPPTVLPNKADKEPAKPLAPAKSPAPTKSPTHKPVKPEPPRSTPSAGPTTASKPSTTGAPNRPTPPATRKPPAVMKKALPKEEQPNTQPQISELRGALRPTSAPVKPRPKPPAERPKAGVVPPKAERPRLNSASPPRADKSREQPAATEKPADSLDSLTVEVTTQPLSHLTANRARRQNKRPPGRFAKKIAEAEAAQMAESEQKASKDIASNAKDSATAANGPPPATTNTSKPLGKADTALAEQLRNEISQLTKKVAEMEAAFNSRIEELESRLDEHKIARGAMQVELQRLNRRANKL